ncbi:MAG: lysoplasmalogenase family protein, partial [Lutibacter sp.]|nr:lysoplasmalogenase family protein [Lutibacter sp.]
FHRTNIQIIYEYITAWLIMLFGAVIFMISDSLLAINKFYNPAHILEIFVMITYVLSQYFIFRSMAQKNAMQKSQDVFRNKVKFTEG